MNTNASRGIWEDGQDPETGTYVVDPRILAYVPAVPAHHWEPICEFVRFAVDRARPSNAQEVRTWMHAVCHLSLWCWKNAGLPLNVETVLASDTIDRYIGFRKDVQPATRGTIRARLRQVARKLEQHVDTAFSTPLPKAQASRPYTRAELTALRASTHGQSTKHRRRNLEVLLALGGGAGLNASELMGLRYADISRNSGHGIDVTVVAKYTRIVPLVREWEDLLEPHLEEGLNAGDWVFLPNSSNRSKNAISSLLAKTSRSGPRPNLPRLRSTWVVAQLNASVPLPALMYGVGVEWLTSIGRYVPYATPLSVEDAVEHLRLEQMDS